MRLKVEINCLENFNVMGLTKIPFEVNSSWFSGKAELTTYHFEELMGTKLRALYQRKKGRDLFDIYEGLRQRELDINKVLKCYTRYMEFVTERAPSYKEFVQNITLKMQDKEFLTDVLPLLRPEIDFNTQKAYESVYTTFIDHLPGRRD